MQTQVLMASEAQTIVVYVSNNAGEMVDPVTLWGDVAVDARDREARGWRIVSTTVMPMRQMGTAGNILFQSGGQYVTQEAVVVVYAK
jgi:hypothetical protein